MTFIQLAARVRSSIGQHHRYAHTLRVARMAASLARRHGEAPQRARLAGMLHDIARLYPEARLLEECRARNLPIDPFEAANPIVLHAPLGAALARERFGIEDRGILSAIAKHTLGAAHMSRFDQIVYLADGLEPARDFRERAALAQLAQRDLGAAMRGTLEASLRHLHDTGKTPAPQTHAAARQFGAAEKHVEVRTD